MTLDCFCIGTSSKKKKKKKIVGVNPSKNIIEEKIVRVKPPNNIIQQKIVVESSKSINHMNVDTAMEIHFLEEIIVDILTRLPVQSLLRFKCVSKFWNTLISDPYFKVKHCHHAKNINKKILIARYLPGDRTMSYYCSSLSSSSSSAQPLQKLCCPSNPCGYEILCCCDGLALLWYCGVHLLWNPSTNESIELPNHEFSNATDSTYELGYDSISDDYKILMIDNIGFDSRPPNKILALKSGCWRNIDNHPRGFYNSVCPGDSLAFVRGAFHWICADNLFNYFMISFNISNEVCEEMSLPEGICNIPNYRIYVRRAISVLEGMLCAYCTWREYRESGTFKLWVMKDYGDKESWTKLFTIQEPHLFLAIPKYMFADGEVLLFYNDGAYQGLRTSKGPFELFAACRGFTQGFVYTESLISPNLLIQY